MSSLGKIELMFYTLVRISQFILILWPVIILLVLFTTYRGTGGIKGMAKRILRSLLVTWLILLVFWILAWFADEPIPGVIPEPTNSWVFFGILILLLLIELTPRMTRLMRNQRRLRQIRSVQQLMNVPPDQFEELVATIYRQLGYQAKRVGHSGDHGVDVALRTPDGKKWIVQCKRYRASVGESIIRDLYGTMVSERAEKAILVTTAEITIPAEKWARGKPIELIDGDGLLRLMQQAKARSQENPLLRLLMTISTWFSPPPSQLRHDLPPLCPRCHFPMELHPLRAYSLPGRILYRCVNYPNCRAVLDQAVPNLHLPSGEPHPEV